MQDRDRNIVRSGLSRTVTSDGVSIDVLIYPLEHDPKAILMLTDMPWRHDDP